MNIAIVVRSLRIGGMERVAANLSDSFVASGHNVSLIYLKDKPVLIKPDNDKVDIRLINLDRILVKSGIGIFWLLLSSLLNIFLRKSLFIWKGLVQSYIFNHELRKIEKDKGHFDLVIVRGQGTHELIWKIKDNRFIIVCENLLYKKKVGFLEKIYAKFLFNNKNLACVSRGVYENLLEYVDITGIKPCNAEIMTNPLNFDKIKEKSKIKLPEIPKEKYILGLGRLVKQKNFELLIRAYKILVEKYACEENLVIAGDGKERKKLESLVESLNLRERVFFAGFTDNPYAWMKNSEVFVLSSNFEGLGMVIIEALASGVNVVATDSPGGVRDIMGNDILGDNLSVMDEYNLAKKIKTVKGSKVSEEKLSVVLSKFSGESIVKGFIDYSNRIKESLNL